MKILLASSLFLMAAFSQAAAQDSTAQETTHRKTRFGISAGPSFVDYIGPAYFPEISYHVGIFGVTRFRRSSLQYGAQYFPTGATYKDPDAYSRFVNHFVNFYALSKLGFPKTPRLSYDIGASFGSVFSYHDSYVPASTSPTTCDCIGVGAGQPIQWQLFFLTGFSWELPKGNGVGLVTLLAPAFGKATYGSVDVIQVQGSFSHTFN